MSRIVNIISGTYNAVFRPAELVRVRGTSHQTSIIQQFDEIWTLISVYLANLALYAAPLTLAGFGRQSVPPMPDWFSTLIGMGNSSLFWELSYSFLQNSLSILGATVLTLVTFHIGLWITFQSKGFLETTYAVIYSTSVYLAGIFSIVWYLSLNKGVADARQFVINIQKEFVYMIIDFLGADLGLPGGRPDSVTLAGLSTEGELVLTILVILLLYYLYTLYLGARINHDATRSYSLLAIGLVVTSPAIYVALTVIAYTTQFVPTL